MRPAIAGLRKTKSKYAMRKVNCDWKFSIETLFSDRIGIGQPHDETLFFRNHGLAHYFSHHIFTNPAHHALIGCRAFEGLGLLVRRGNSASIRRGTSPSSVTTLVELFCHGRKAIHISTWTLHPVYSSNHCHLSLVLPFYCFSPSRSTVWRTPRCYCSHYSLVLLKHLCHIFLIFIGICFP